MAEEGTKKGIGAGWIIFWIVPILLILFGVYMMFFSDWGKKRKLIRDIRKKFTGKADPKQLADTKKLMSLTIAKLQEILAQPVPAQGEMYSFNLG